MAARPKFAALVVLLALVATGCAGESTDAGKTPKPTHTGFPLTAAPRPSPTPEAPPQPGNKYPWHTNIVSTTFWVGEIFDPNAPDGSQMYSTYDSRWYESYGGCDGIVTASGGCETEVRTADNGYYPTSMTPKQNPFYLDLPYDDLNNTWAHENRSAVIPWAQEPAAAKMAGDSNQSMMKNRWVVLRKGDRTCYGQIQDAGPAVYDDANYVFGTNDERPANTRFNGAGMDVSPALNGCLGFSDINGMNDLVDWAFIDEHDVPDGPWKWLVTTTPVQ